MDRAEIAKAYPRTVAAASKSRKAAIKLFCLECVGGSRIEVKRCTDAGCPLYRYRPYREAT